MLASTAKRDLITVATKTGETVDEYYHRLFKLYENAETPEDERMVKFEATLRPSISRTLMGHDFTNMIELLTKAGSVENKSRNNGNYFPRGDISAQKSFRQ